LFGKDKLETMFVYVLLAIDDAVPLPVDEEETEVVIKVPVTAGTVTKLPVPDANCNTPELSADWVSPLVVVAVIIDAIIIP
jgi:hypothetical protein